MVALLSRSGHTTRTRLIFTWRTSISAITLPPTSSSKRSRFTQLERSCSDEIRMNMPKRWRNTTSTSWPSVLTIPVMSLWHRMPSSNTMPSYSRYTKIKTMRHGVWCCSKLTCLETNWTLTPPWETQRIPLVLETAIQLIIAQAWVPRKAYLGN